MSVPSVFVSAAVAILLFVWARRGHGEASLLLFLFCALAGGILARFTPLRSSWLPDSEALLGVPSWDAETNRKLEQPTGGTSDRHVCAPCGASPARTDCGLADPDPWDAVERARSERAETIAHWLAGAFRSARRWGYPT